MAITPRLDLFLNYNDPSRPVLVSAASLAYARGVQVVGGENVTMRVYLVNATGSSPTYVVPSDGDTIRFSAKKQASDEELVYLFDEWTIGGSYVEATADFATVEDFWANATEAAKSLISNFEVETESGLVRKWSFFTQVVRQSYGGEAPPVNPGETYVKYTAQTPTTEQQDQALDNLGGSASGKIVFQGTPAEARAALEITGSGDVVSDGTITSANAGKVAVIGSTTKQIGAGVSYATAATASTLVLRDASANIAVNGITCTTVECTGETSSVSLIVANNFEVNADGNLAMTGAAEFAGNSFFRNPVWFGPNALGSAEGTIIEASGIYGYSALNTSLWNISNDTGEAVFTSISAASGAFYVSNTGDMTATHGKFQGSGGQAGHWQLKQGTAPSGTASETTVWGIAGGIGWRDGTGTAYSLTLPTATGTLGVLASVTEELAGTSSTVTSSPATGHVKAIYQSYRTAFSAAAFAQAVSGTGAATGTTDWGVDVTGPTTAVGYGIRRNAPTNSFAASRGKGRGVIAWGRRVELVGTACIYAGLDANAVFRVTFGKTTGDNAGNLARRGLGFRVQGTGALEIETHNGTTRTASTNSTFTPTVNQAFDFRITSDGSGNCVLWINDTQVATCTGGPTTDSSSTENALQAEMENVSTVTTQSSATAGNFGVYLARA